MTTNTLLVIYIVYVIYSAIKITILKTKNNELKEENKLLKQSYFHDGLLITALDRLIDLDPDAAKLINNFINQTKKYSKLLSNPETPNDILDTEQIKYEATKKDWIEYCDNKKSENTFKVNIVSDSMNPFNLPDGIHQIGDVTLKIENGIASRIYKEDK